MIFEKITKEQAQNKLATLCAQSERNETDLRYKLIYMGIGDDDIEDIIEFLKNHNFINEKRYAEAFVRDKFILSQWGKQKIVHTLMNKKISSEIIHKALEQIDEDEYQETLKKLIEQKRKTLKEDDPYKEKAKIIAFLAQRGFELDDIYRILGYEE